MVCYNFKIFCRIVEKTNFEETQCVNMCYLPSREITGRILGVQPFPQ
ncbi:hypothetical protein AB205_0022380 [Aquarana catesbeiana]|uniref:Uncharacterized protein n=1 Tax=Aquarana catesbeiana TaxID=8400 RepID=A0A2G9QEV5_AQUCT|nr:hypothetical protein AB205_0022380 [Aquarana catesbeiana]